MLPGLAPHHTRASFCSGTRLYVEKHAPEVDSYQKTEEGLWLLPTAIAERDRAAGESKLSEMGDRQASEDMAEFAERSYRGAKILGETVITETGCMVGGLDKDEKPHEWAKFFAEKEWGTFVLTEDNDMPHLNVCGCPECYNSRHYDIAFGRNTLKERTIEVNPLWYETLPSGRLRTIWGDILPSVEKSLEYFMKFQRKNFPFVPMDKSRLTASGISQIRFHPVTGCWEAWQYYIKPPGANSWQFDGYGRLYQVQRQQLNKSTGELTANQRRGHWMAHRVAWLATGRRFKSDPETGQMHFLNHLCSYRRCCNPLHIRQESPSANTKHGVRVQAAIRELEHTDERARDYYLSVEEMKPAHVAIRALYTAMAESAMFASA